MSTSTSMRSAVRRWLDEAVLRVRERGWKALLRAVRLTAAAVASYLIADALLATNKPIVAPLTTLLVVQVTLYRTLTNALQRVVGVVVGVVLAIVFSGGAGLEVWSLAAVVAASIVVGQLLRLGEQLLEVPISAMLILAVGGAENPATDRITETLLGALVGLLYNVVLPPPVESQNAGAALERFAGEMADLLDRVAAEIPEVVTAELQVSYPGLPTDYDAMRVTIVRLAGGRHVVWWGLVPDDSPEAVRSAVAASAESLTARK